ncbi:MAG: hypothetical protein AAFY24_24515, partial [Pseudomonadota bacterium]
RRRVSGAHPGTSWRRWPADNQSVPSSTPPSKPASNLPPLDPPVSIEDLITQDVGAPLVLPGAQ